MAFRNLPIVQHFFETLNMSPENSPEINGSLLSSENILQTKSNLSENKDNFANVQIPLVIQAAIGGDVEIFQYLTSMKAKVDVSGPIGLSRKYKNIVISNPIGAAAYYGKVELLHLLISQYQIDLNFKTSEKKSKLKQINLNKEFSDTTPLTLAIVGEVDEETALEVVKLLIKNCGDPKLSDANKNNILHLTVKYNRPAILKYLIENLQLSDLLKDLNKEGQTPVAIAQSSNQPETVNYLSSLLDDKNIENELLEMYENSEKQKAGKKKKKQKSENTIGLLNSVGFEETLQIKPKLESKLAPEQTAEAKKGYKAEEIKSEHKLEDSKEHIVQNVKEKGGNWGSYHDSYESGRRNNKSYNGYNKQYNNYDRYQEKDYGANYSNYSNSSGNGYNNYKRVANASDSAHKQGAIAGTPIQDEAEPVKLDKGIVGLTVPKDSKARKSLNNNNSKVENNQLPKDDAKFDNNTNPKEVDVEKMPDSPKNRENFIGDDVILEETGRNEVDQESSDLNKNYIEEPDTREAEETNQNSYPAGDYLNSMSPSIQQNSDELMVIRCK